MRERMAAAPVGDDVFGDDPTVNALETRVANLAGKEAALLLPSGTQSNLVGLLAHCQRGEEYIVGQDYHTYLYEAGGGAVFGGSEGRDVRWIDGLSARGQRFARGAQPDCARAAAIRIPRLFARRVQIRIQL